MHQIKHKFDFGQWDMNNNNLAENYINYVLINVVLFSKEFQKVLTKTL